mgnify:CR=1 FL=1
MVFRKFIFVILLISLNINAIAQSDIKFANPVDFPITLSGSFAELRSNHFHAGIDIKTYGQTGRKVFAIEDGFVARIKVAGGGYGHALYIQHPNGYTSVYAHLEGFNQEISAFVKEEQYRKQSFEVNLFPNREKFKVKKGQLIAFTGNTGGSNGPHLHFEIRKTKNQHPINPLFFDFGVKDNTYPRINSIAIYPLDKEASINGANKKLFLPTKQIDNSTYAIESLDSLRLSGNIGFGVETFDYFDESYNRCGIYLIELYINDSLAFASEFDEFAFHETRYINSYIDYAERIRNKKYIQRAHKLPNNPLSILKEQKDGRIQIRENQDHKIYFKIVDSYGNTSKIEFMVHGVSAVETKAKESQETNGSIMYWDRDNGFIKDDIQIEVPALALYENIHFDYDKKQNPGLFFSDIHQVHNEGTPLQKNINISIKLNRAFQKDKNKLLLMRIDNEGEMNAVGGEYNNNFITARTRDFGNYVVYADTIPPIIKPEKMYHRDTIRNKLSFIIEDELSGIKSYNGFIDGKWALFEYDPKEDRIFYRIDKARLSKQGLHELEIYVTDNKDNITTYYLEFYTDSN